MPITRQEEKENKQFPGIPAYRKPKELGPRKRVAILSENKKAVLEPRRSQPVLEIAKTKPPFHVHFDSVGETCKPTSSTAKPGNSVLSRGNGENKPCVLQSATSRKVRIRSPETRKPTKPLPSRIPRLISSASKETAKPSKEVNNCTCTLKSTFRKTPKLRKTFYVSPEGKRFGSTTIVITPSTSPQSGSSGRLKLGPRENSGWSSRKSFSSSEWPMIAFSKGETPECETTDDKNNFHLKSSYTRYPGILNCNAEYHASSPSVEREKEEAAPKLSANFLKKDVNADQRKIIVTFMLRTGANNRYPTPVVYEAVKLFDAVIDRMKLRTATIQLVSIACLWIALKKHENFHKVPSATAMIKLADDLYPNREDLLIAYERKILQILNFNIIFPDTYSLFAYHMINYYSTNTISVEKFTSLYYAGCYVIDTTLLDEWFCQKSASLVALAAAELVLGLILDSSPPNGSAEKTFRPRWLFWRGVLYTANSKSYERFSDKEVDRCRIRMLNCVLKSQEKGCCLRKVYTKYNSSKYHRISVPLLNQANKVSFLELINL